MPKFRKKPVEIEAMRYHGTAFDFGSVEDAVAFDDWIASKQGDRKCQYVGRALQIATLEGDMIAEPGDWIICGVKGELYPCKPDIFAQTYDPA